MEPACSPKKRREHAKTMQQIRGVARTFEKRQPFGLTPTLGHPRSYTNLGYLGDVPWSPVGLFNADAFV